MRPLITGTNAFTVAFQPIAGTLSISYDIFAVVFFSNDTFALIILVF